MRADIYRNLHKGCMSIRSREKGYYGRVVAHAESMLMHNCSFVVRKKGQQKVIATKRKNVHAFVRGVVKMLGIKTSFPGLNSHGLSTCDLSTLSLDGWVEVTYNPYQNNSFVVRASSVPVMTARMVLIRENKVYARL